MTGYGLLPEPDGGLRSRIAADRREQQARERPAEQAPDLAVESPPDERGTPGRFRRLLQQLARVFGWRRGRR